MKEYIRLLGKGPGFAAGFYVALAGVFGTALVTKDAALVGALTAPLGVACAAFYGGGGWKAHSEARSGGGAAGSTPGSQPPLP